MDVFELRDQIIAEDYARYTRSFIEIADRRIQAETDARLADGCLWPEPLLQLNPSYEYSAHISDLVRDGLLHPDCSRFFLSKGREVHLYRHQEQAIKKALSGDNYILTSGTGSGKSLSYIAPIVNSLLNAQPASGIQAILVYPMNALVNSQKEDLDKFFAGRAAPFSYAIYTGQEDGKKREGMIQNPPNILLTNYMMLKLLLTRKHESQLVRAMANLEFLVLDELHTYRGRKGADVSLLVRRLRGASGRDFQCIGTSATLASGNTRLEKLEAVAAIGKTIFGVDFQADDVIVETLHSPAAQVDGENPAFRRELASWIESGAKLPEKQACFFKNPLVAWLNGAIGVRPSEGELERCQPRPLAGKTGLAGELAEMCGRPEEFCANLIRQALLAGEMKLQETENQAGPEWKFEPFLPFRLHQFVSTGDTVFSTLESPDKRYITLNGQRFAPGREERIPLYRLQFCRECGKEFYSVTLRDGEEASFEPREEQFGALASQEQDGRGFLFLAGEEDAWPDNEEEILERIPETWIEEKKGERRIITARKKLLPRRYFVTPDGTATTGAREGAIEAWFMPGKFQFCPACQVSYDSHIGELAKLSTLGTAGRSTSNSVLAMSTINHLGQTDEPPKLLCFSDNRQDASLQAGNFNDFAETGLMRSALYHALKAAGPTGVSHDRLGDSILAALDACQPGGKFPTELYMKSPDAQAYAARDARRAFADLLEYYAYADLERGWKLVSPNLEKCGLLKFEYRSLPEICADDALWQKSALLSRAGAELRLLFGRELLDYLRIRLVLDAPFLNREEHTSLARRTAANLRAPWIIEEKGYHSYARKLIRTETAKREEGALRLTPLSKAGIWLKRRIPSTTLEERARALEVIGEVFESQGIFTSVNAGRDRGWQIRHDCITWKVGDGAKSAPMPMSLHRTSIAPRKPNPFFLDFYRTAASADRLLHSEPHTAQVSTKDREDREQRFRAGSLPVLFCSPTMELGINIEDLCVTGMRNVPPTPANYAQRSGRAGRHGQAALVLTYCAKGSPHDQHFFRRPERMVAGMVSTPQIDLANEDLVRAHIHAIWLACSGLDLRSSLMEIIDTGDIGHLPLQPDVIEDLNDSATMQKARTAALTLLESLEEPLAKSSWYSPNWLDDTLNALPENFDAACNRWRELFRDAKLQQKNSRKPAQI